MDKIKIFLFGKFCVCYGNQPLDGLEVHKVQELFAYLVVNRNRFHSRDKLADLLWSNSSPLQSKQYLRQTLCQLKAILDKYCETDNNILSIESEWIKINPAADLWTDIDEFKKAYSQALGMQGRALTEQIVDTLQVAVDLYQGEFLENWYQDWCIFERERFQNIYLTMLDKLMGYCETHQRFEQGIEFGFNILRCDVAKERTYRRLMRLYNLAGDRTGALRQYERCIAALERELSTKPSNLTVELYDLLKRDQIPEGYNKIDQNDVEQNQTVFLAKIITQLTQVGRILHNAHQQIEKDIDEVRTIIDK